MAYENLPKLELEQGNVKAISAAIALTRGVVMRSSEKIRSDLLNFRDPGKWQSGESTKSYLIADSVEVANLLDKFADYLENAEAMVLGHGRKLSEV